MTRRHDLEDRIDRLGSLRGEGTELVTVAVPPDGSLRGTRERIRRERTDAENIRDDATRDRVQRALDRIDRLLAGYGDLPENGLVTCAGVVDGDLVSSVFDDLPAPVPASTYHCDDKFGLEPLEAAASVEDPAGLVVVERGGAALGRLVGERVVPVRTMESAVMGQSRAGGQSAKRFERERRRQRREFFGEVAAAAREAFLGEDPVGALAVGGTLGTAESFASGDYLDHRLRDRLVGTYAVEYAGVQGLQGLVEAARDDLLDAARRESRERLDEFFTRLKEGDPVAYGTDHVERAAEYGAVETALVAASVPRDRRADLEAAVTDQGGTLLVVPADTERGEQFARAFDGVGALLRFPVE